MSELRDRLARDAMLELIPIMYSNAERRRLSSAPTMTAPEEIAAKAYWIADAMIKEGAKKLPEQQ